MTTPNCKSKNISKQSQTEHTSINQCCPPSTPHELYRNLAIDAVDEQYGSVIKNFSKEVESIITDATSTAIDAALKAAHVSNDWKDITNPNSTKPKANIEECKRFKDYDPAQYSPLWKDMGTNDSIDLYRYMAWQAQIEKYPHFMCTDCLGLDREAAGEMMNIVDYMIDFALTAAGVANDWNKIFEATKAKMEGKK